MSKQQVHKRKPAPRRSGTGGGASLARTSPVTVVVAAALVVLVLATAGFALFNAFGAASGTFAQIDDPTASPTATDAQAAGNPAPDARVSFVAVGDNLPEESIGTYADACVGAVGDGAYDYRPIYAAIKPYIESADLAYVKQETHIGGDDIGPRGWPSFNTTSAMADAIVDAGFDFVASASNHSYDWGYYGAVEYSRSVWNQKPVAFTGTATSDEEAQTLATLERNGITFALLDYTYGVNGYTQADLPSYAVNFIDEDRIAADVARAKESADVVLVAMHWGTENETYADEEQLRLAQFLADLEVDVVLGSHPHVIGPLAWVEGQSGKRTLVAYSLGNFISRHEAPALENELEGMLSCDFVRKGGEISIENVVWTPLVNHTEENLFSVYAVKDYTPELAAKHVSLSQMDDPIGQLKALNREIVGSEFTIDDQPADDQPADDQPATASQASGATAQP